MKARARTWLSFVSGAVIVAVLPIAVATSAGGQEQPLIAPPTVKPLPRSTGSAPQALKIPGPVKIIEPMRPAPSKRPPTVFERCAAYPSDRPDNHRPIYCRTVP